MKDASMDAETKLRFEDIERRFTAVDKRFDEQGRRFDDQGKRFDDIKSLVAIISTVFTLLLATFTLVSGWNYSNERQTLRDFQKELKEQFGKGDDTTLELIGLNRAGLDGQEIDARIEKLSADRKSIDPNGVPFLTFDYIVKNSGLNASGPLYMKIYTKAGIVLDTKSSDEAAYAYESVIGPESLNPSSFPGQMSISQYLNVQLPVADSYTIDAGKHDALMKIYYGKGKVAKASVVFKISSRWTSSP